MPCRCDGYEVTVDANHLKGLEEKVKHLEGQLCAARSVVHKLLRALEEGSDYDSIQDHVSDELRAQARAHRAALLAHKRAESDADRDRLAREHLRAGVQLEGLLADAHRVRAANEAHVARLQNQLDELRARQPQQRAVPTDDELLG